MNPYEIPRRPKVTIREILPWIGERPSVIAADLRKRFKISINDAFVRLNKLWKWGYLRRQKSETPPRIYLYSLTGFGKRTVKKWDR